MKLIEVEIRGTTPLMHHRFTEDALQSLLGAKTRKLKTDEPLTPRQIAQKHVYETKEGKFYIPSEFISGAMQSVASDYKQENSPRKTLKPVIKGVARVTEPTIILLDHDNTPIASWEVDLRPAKNHQKGAVAVCRPRFDRWKCKFTMSIDDSVVPAKTVHEIIRDSGKRSGIGSFRVSNGGIFGQFEVLAWKEIQ